jgi:hypothetical protein
MDATLGRMHAAHVQGRDLRRCLLGRSLCNVVAANAPGSKRSIYGSLEGARGLSRYSNRMGTVICEPTAD